MSSRGCGLDDSADPRPPLPEQVTGRRQLLGLAGAGLLTAALAACGGGGSEAAKTKTTSTKTSGGDRNDAKALTAATARKRLEDGNKRFSLAKASHPDQSSSRRKKLNTNGQKPFACVVSCADSRVPPEVVFDQGLGDLFVVRSAGQVLDHALVGTLQFGVEEFSTPLLVVLGHSKCGAVKATLEAVEKKSAASGTDVDALVAAIKPSVVAAQTKGGTEETILSDAIAGNVERIVGQLAQFKVLSAAVAEQKLKIMGAVYDLGTGKVAFL